MKLNRMIVLAVLSFLALTISLPVYAASAALSFAPTTARVAVGGTTTLDIVVDSASAKTVGTDVIVKYDTARLELVGITKGNVYSSYATEVKDPTAGTVSLSGFVSQNELGTGIAVKGVFAKITFKGKAPGNAQVNFDFTQGESKDSNVVEAAGSGGDILTSAGSATITVGAGGGSVATPAASPSVGGAQPPLALPDAASMNPTVMVIVAGMLFVLLGGIGLLLSVRP